MTDTELGHFRKVSNDPFTAFVDAWVFRCPGCGREAYMDEDQWHGRVSVECHHGCGYHETHDYRAVLLAAMKHD